MSTSKLKPITDELNIDNYPPEKIDKRGEVLSKYRQYGDAKNAAVDFQQAKNKVIVASLFHVKVSDMYT